MWRYTISSLNPKKALHYLQLISQMMNHLQKINREFGKTILIVEQKVRDVLKICDHVYSIKLGRIAYSGPPEPLETDTGKMKELFL